MIKNLSNNLLKNLYVFIFTLCIIEQDIGYLSPIPYEFISVLVILLLISNCKEKINYNALGVTFLLYLPLSLSIASPPEVFRSWERLAFFSLIYTVASPIIQSNKLVKFRSEAFWIFLKSCTVIGVASFISYFIDINYMGETHADDPNLFIDGGYFSGITKHSMILGVLSGLGTMCSLSKYFGTKKNIWIIIFICCAGSVMFSASRGAFISTLIGCFVLLYRSWRLNHIEKKHIYVVIFFALLTSPIWGRSFNNVMNKYRNHINDVELFDSRAEKVRYRIADFKSSPIWGVGFSAFARDSDEGYIMSTGTVEPGSSWLAILSMTGTIGFLLFFTMWGNSIKYLIRENDAFAQLHFSVLVFISLHMLIEGYIFAAGNPLCFFSLLVIGCSYDRKYGKGIAQICNSRIE